MKLSSMFIQNALYVWLIRTVITRAKEILVQSPSARCRLNTVSSFEDEIGGSTWLPVVPSLYEACAWNA